MSDDKDQMTPADFRDFFPTARPARLQQVINERDARIRLLEQQLSTAREALEPFAAAWNVHSGKPDVLRHLTLGDLGALAAHHVSGIHFKNAAAAIRSLGEPGAHPPGK